MCNVIYGSNDYSVYLCKQSILASTKALQAAKAVNSLIHLSSRDQDSLKAVVEDYFITPGSQTDDSDTQESDVEPGIQNNCGM